MSIILARKNQTLVGGVYRDYFSDSTRITKRGAN